MELGTSWYPSLDTLLASQATTITGIIQHREIVCIMPPSTNSNEKKLNLPVEQVPSAIKPEQVPNSEQLPTRVEQAPVAAEQPAPSTVPPAPATAQVLQPTASQVVTNQQSPDPVAAVIQQKTANLPAEDVGMIEKEWVDVVDDTIAKTQDDPEVEERAQQELNRAYLKKRFNLDVDTSPENKS